jgi:phage tail-like protein
VGSLQIHDAIVYNTTSVTGWTDLDLSSIVGSQKASCLFAIGHSVNARRVAIRPKGSGPPYEPLHIDSSAHGSCYTQTQIGKYRYIRCPTDASGVVQIRTDTASGTLTIYLISYINPDKPTYRLVNSDLSISETSFDNMDISADVGSARAFADVLNAWSGSGSAGGVYASKHFDDTRTPAKYADSGVRAGMNRGILTASGRYGLLSGVITDDQGRYKHTVIGPVSGIYITFECAEVANFVDTGEVVINDAILEEKDYQDVDFSSEVPGRAWVFAIVEVESGNTQTPIVSARRKGDAKDYSFDIADNGHGPAVVQCDGTIGRVGMVHWECDTDGIVEVYTDYGTTPTDKIKITLVGYIVANEPPTVSGGYPTGSSEDRDVEIGFVCEDDQQVDIDTIDLNLAGPGGSLDAIIGGVFQSGFTGTITPNLNNGYDVVLDGHIDLVTGLWTATATVEDGLGASGSDNWQFTTKWIPQALSVVPVARRVIEITFDMPVIVRDLTQDLVAPDDRYTPVDWVGNGGNSFDAANPDNFVLSRPSSGSLVSPGEAADIESIVIAEVELERTEESTYFVSPVIRVTLDYQMTARASYKVSIANIKHSAGEVIVPVDVDFTGYIVSQVDRNSLILIDTLPDIVQIWDNEGTGDLAKFFTAIQEVFERILEDVDSFFLETSDIDKMREEFLDLALYDLGNPFFADFPSLSANQKRKLLSILVALYKQKGTCVGLLNVVLFFTGVQLDDCKEPWDLTWILEHATRGLLGTSTYLGPSAQFDLYSFWVVSSVVLTAEQITQINAIADYMKPAHTHFLGIIQPSVGVSPEFWSIGTSKLGTDTKLLP